MPMLWNQRPQPPGGEGRKQSNGRADDTRSQTATLQLGPVDNRQPDISTAFSVIQEPLARRHLSYSAPPSPEPVVSRAEKHLYWTAEDIPNNEGGFIVSM